MKKTAYLWLLLVAFTFVACGGTKSKVIGKWEVASINDKATNGKVLVTMDFGKDGKFTQTRGDESRSGKWELSKDGKNIEVYPEGKKSEMMEIVSVDAENLTFKDGRNRVTLKKRK